MKSACAWLLGLAVSGPHALAQMAAPCPKLIAEEAQCWQGKDPRGSYYWIARPREWNGTLIVHAHGGPRTSAPKPDSEVEDLERFAVFVKEGYAFAAASYREGGYVGVAAAAEDTEDLRLIYVEKFGAPRRVIAHGQSWGGGVAAHLIERFAMAPDGKRSYDAVLLTSGLVAGNARAYGFRADLRAVYQYYCGNHPRANEPQYPLGMGLPAEARLTNAELEARMNECTGLRTPADKRTPQQQSNLRNILAVIHIPEKSLAGNMNWSTFLFRDIAKRLDGRSPFTNTGVRYAGSDDDEALNKGVARFAADPGAAAAFASDGRLTGKVPVPVVTMHAIDDPVVFVEQDFEYRRVLENGGSGDRIVQTWTREAEHSYLGTPQYAALIESLMRWVEKGEKPTRGSIAEACRRHAARYEGGCHFDLDFEPRPLDERQYPR